MYQVNLIKTRIDKVPLDGNLSLSDNIRGQKAFGTNYGLTAKVPKDSLRITAGAPKEHVADIGSGIPIHREFCGTCGSFILEYGVGRSFSSYLYNTQRTY